MLIFFGGEGDIFYNNTFKHKISLKKRKKKNPE